MNFPILARTLLGVFLLIPAAVLAQAPPPSKSPAAPPKAVHDPSACADSKVTTGQGGDAGPAQQKGGTLSDKLAQSKGVICPPRHVDEDIKAPTPRGGRMPVIPPPGSPGGNPNVQPK
jgi:hypothetical protein